MRDNLKMQRKLHLLAFLWLLLLLLVAILDPLGYGRISIKAIILNLVFGTVFLSCGYIYRPGGWISECMPVAKTNRKVYALMAMFLVFAAVYLAIRFMNIYDQTVDYTAIRRIVYRGYGEGHLYPAAEVHRIYQIFINPVLMYFLAVSFYKGVSQRMVWPIVLALLLVVVFSVIEGSRLLFIYSAIIYYFVTVVKKGRLIQARQILILFFSLCAAVTVSYLRAPYLPYIAEKYFLGYQIAGFFLFSRAIGESGLLSEYMPTLGAYFFKPVLDLFIYAINFFLSSPINSPSSLLHKELDEKVVLDPSRGGISEFNAFYTGLFPLYADGGLVGIVTGAIVISLVFSYCIKRALRDCDVSGLASASLIFCGIIGSVWNAPLSGPALQLPIVTYLGYRLIINLQFSGKR